MQCHKELVHLLIHHLKLSPESLWDVTWCISVHVKAERVNLPLLVCLIFGLSMAVIARPHALLSACSCTSTHPTPAFPSASLLSFSHWPSAVQPAARGLGEHGEGRRMEREEGWWREGGGGTTPVFLPCLRSHPVSSTPSFYIIHSGTSACGTWGGSPPKNGSDWLLDGWF